MSNISTVYDTVLTALENLFPNKTRVPNAYNLPNNNELFLRDGYGLRIDSGTPSPEEFCNWRIAREFTIVFTREVLKTDSATSNEDTVVKQLLEDVYTVQKDFYNVDRLGITEQLEFVNLGASSGIIEFFGERERFKSIDATFFINISENL